MVLGCTTVNGLDRQTADQTVIVSRADKRRGAVSYCMLYMGKQDSIDAVALKASASGHVLGTDSVFRTSMRSPHANCQALVTGPKSWRLSKTACRIRIIDTKYNL